MTRRLLLLAACAACALGSEGNQAPSFSVPSLVLGSENQETPIILTISEAVPGPAAEYEQGFDLLVTAEDGSYGVVKLGAVTRLTPEGMYPATFTVALPVIANSWGEKSLLVTANDLTGTANALTTRRVRVQVAHANVPPVFHYSESVRVEPGGSVVLGYDNLSVSDADTPLAEVVFTLASAPTLGALTRSGMLIAPGDPFTQLDLASGRVAYQSSGEAGVDGFAVTITDGVIPVPLGPFPVNVLVGAGEPASVVVVSHAGSWREGDGPATILIAWLQMMSADSLRGGALTAAIIGGERSGDVLSLAERGLPIDGWSGGADGAPLVATISGAQSTREAVNELLAALRFDHNGDDPGADPRIIQLVVHDGTAASSLPVSFPLAIVPVDDPPVVITTRLATVVGLARSVVLAARDPDSAALTWAVAGQPDNAVVTMLDAAAGLLRIVPTASGRSAFAVTVADATSTVSASIILVVTGADDARPHAAGTLPHDGYAGEAVSVDLPWDLRDLPADASLAFSATGAPPGDLVLTPLAADRVRVAFAIPAAAGPQPVFGLLAEDAASGAAAHLPVHLLVRPRPEARR